MFKNETGAYKAPQVEQTSILDNGVLCTSNVNDMDYTSGSWEEQQQ